MSNLKIVWKNLFAYLLVEQIQFSVEELLLLKRNFLCLHLCLLLLQTFMVALMFVPILNVYYLLLYYLLLLLSTIIIISHYLLVFIWPNFRATHFVVIILSSIFGCIYVHMTERSH